MIRLPFVRLSISLLQVGLVTDPSPTCQHDEEESDRPMSIGFTSHMVDPDVEEE